MKQFILFNGTAKHSSLESATTSASLLTKIYKEYHTALKGSDGFWYVTNQFDPRVPKES